MSRKEREVVFTNEYRNSGIQLILTRKGIEACGWYDSFVGIQGGFISWDQLDVLRDEVGQIQTRSALRGQAYAKHENV